MRLLGHLLLFSILLFSLLGCQPSDRGIDAVELDISNPVELLDIQLDPGGSIYYRIDIGQTTVLHAAITLEESNADILVDLLDYNENSLEQTNLSGLCRSLYTAVSPGSYYIRINNNSSQILYCYDFSLEGFNLSTCGAVSSTNPVLEVLDIQDLESSEDYCFFFFDSIADGIVHLSLDPEVDLDISLEVYNSPLLGTGDVFVPFQTKDSGPADAIEQLDISVSTRRYFIRAIANDISGLSHCFDISLEYSSH